MTPDHKARFLAKKAMREACLDAYDHQTGDIDYTRLAEAGALSADHPEWLDDDIHPVWDWALTVGDAYVHRIPFGAI